MARTPHERRMDEMAKRIAEALHGETLEDAAYVCAAVIGHAILQLPRQYRDELRRNIAIFINETIEDNTQRDLN